MAGAPGGAMLWVTQQPARRQRRVDWDLSSWSVTTCAICAALATARSAMTDKPFRILGIPGSLRRASYNRGLLRAAREDAPDEVDFVEVDLSTIPLFNEDVEAQGDPSPVRVLK